jgi:hypothetical protein
VWFIKPTTTGCHFMGTYYKCVVCGEECFTLPVELPHHYYCELKDITGSSSSDKTLDCRSKNEGLIPFGPANFMLD